MKISLVTLFPEMVSCFLRESIAKRARDEGLVDLQIVDLRDFAIDKHGTVDDRPYGGGAGMVLKVDVIWRALSKLKIKSSKLKVKTILTSPKGEVFNQKKAKEYSRLDHLILVAGHYEGVDERVSSFVDEEISLGDFVLTGGEIVISAIADSVIRLVPDVLERKEATEKESFFEVPLDTLIRVVGARKILKRAREKGVEKVKLLEYPHYTRPATFKNQNVPKVLLSGNHEEIERWRLKKAFEETINKRKDLLLKETDQ